MTPLPEASAEFERAVAALPPESWERTTPCEVSVRELVAHVVAGNLFAARLLGGASREDARSDIEADPLGADVLCDVRTSAAAQEAAFRAADRGRPLPHPSGDIDYGLFLCFRLVDLVVHAWDVRRGADIEEELDPLVITRLWELVEPRLPDMWAYGAYGPGASDDLPGDVSVQHRLLDAFGRRP